MAKQISKLKIFMKGQPTLDSISQEVHKLAFSNEAKDSTIASRYSMLKKYLRENHTELDSKFLFDLNPPINLTYKVNDRNKLIRANKANFIYDQNLVDKILAYGDYINFKQPDLALATYLQFISGRRISELLSSDIKLSIIRNKPTSIKFSYLNKGDSEKTPMIVKLMPNTINNKEFKTKLTFLRKFINSYDNKEQLNKEINVFTNRLNNFLKREFAKKGVHSHVLRGLYASYYFIKYNPDNININGFISDILNHKSDTASLYYSNYKFKDENKNQSLL